MQLHYKLRGDVNNMTCMYCCDEKMEKNGDKKMISIVL